MTDYTDMGDPKQNKQGIVVLLGLILIEVSIMFWQGDNLWGIISFVAFLMTMFTTYHVIEKLYWKEVEIEEIGEEGKNGK